MNRGAPPLRRDLKKSDGPVELPTRAAAQDTAGGGTGRGKMQKAATQGSRHAFVAEFMAERASSGGGGGGGGGSGSGGRAAVGNDGGDGEASDDEVKGRGLAEQGSS